MRLLDRYGHVDTVCHAFVPQWNQIQRAQGQRVRHRTGHLAMREVMPMVIHVHHVRFRDCKTY